MRANTLGFYPKHGIIYLISIYFCLKSVCETKQLMISAYIKYQEFLKAQIQCVAHTTFNSNLRLPLNIYIWLRAENDVTERIQFLKRVCLPSNSLSALFATCPVRKEAHCSCDKRST